MHRGHQVLLNRTLELAKTLNRPACAFTFHPAPRGCIAPRESVVRIQRAEDRIACLLAAGIDHVVLEPFSLDYAKKDARWFAEEVLGRRLQASAVVVGWDFRFGRGRAGGFEELARWMSVPVEQVAAFQQASETVSSSRIRFALHNGDIADAARLLGRPSRGGGNGGGGGWSWDGAWVSHGEYRCRDPARSEMVSMPFRF